MGKLLTEIDRCPKRPIPIDYGPFNPCRIVDQVVGEARIDVLIRDKF